LRGDGAYGEGHGKLILTGEHAVVYGFPAIAVGITTKTTVRLSPHDGPSELVAQGADSNLRQVIDTLCPSGFRISVQSDLPIGRGMGSSAALSVALVRSLAAAQGCEINAGEIYEQAMCAERIFHRNPSGLDAMVSSRGGVLYFRKGAVPVLEPLSTPSWSLIVLDSGQAGSTAAMVEQVSARRPAIDAILGKIGELTEAAKVALSDVRQLGEILNENHRLLRDIGVSNSTLDSLTEVAREAGATGAKLSGAGGGGVVIAITDEPEPALQRIQAQNINAFACTIWAAE
jgi:mevalonate kinase